jgi:uncharacterized protein YegP (UPF0339 family)
MKYDCKFEIGTLEDGQVNWQMRDHKGSITAIGSVYANRYNAKRAMDRHIKVIQSAQFTLPPKPLRKEYTFKKPSHVQQS